MNSPFATKTEKHTSGNKPRPIKGAPPFIRNVSGIADNEYDMESYQPGMSESVTVLPKHDPDTGGIQGSDNPYGAVMEGKSFNKGVDVGSVTHKSPSRKPRAGVDVKVEEEVEVEVEVAPPTPTAVSQATAGLTQLNNAQTYAPAATPSREDDMQYLNDLANMTEGNIANPPVRPGSPMAGALPVPAEILSIPRNRIRVRISGSKFGNYRGHYLHIVDDPNYILLFYDLDSAGYEPPLTDPADPITISCEDKEHKVYYMGMDFDLKMDNLGMQIYIKHKEKK